MKKQKIILIVLLGVLGLLLGTIAFCIKYLLMGV